MTWREGADRDLFAAVRVRPAHRDTWQAEPNLQEWLPIEWPDHEEAPTKYWLSTLPDTTSLDELVDVTKLRWRIERDYRELEQEIGLGHYEGRGFHHHATLCIAAYGFLLAERDRIPPSAPVAGPRRCATPGLPTPRLSPCATS